METWNDKEKSRLTLFIYPKGRIVTRCDQGPAKIHSTNIMKTGQRSNWRTSSRSLWKRYHTKYDINFSLLSNRLTSSFNFINHINIKIIFRPCFLILITHSPLDESYICTHSLYNIYIHMIHYFIAFLNCFFYHSVQ